MYAVGRLISRSIYTVSGPFHPFGGAVDIVVVEQQDASFKSSPWYVRFGKFQGVLKTREKVVSICVNGVEADFHMYLDHTGEAYFLEEVEEEVEEEDVIESSTTGDSTDDQLSNRKPLKSLSCNFDSEGSPFGSPDSVVNGSGVGRSGSKRARLLGLVFGRRLSQGEPNNEIGRTNSLDQAEIAADLLDVNWATSLAVDKPKPQKASHLTEKRDEFNEYEDASCQKHPLPTSPDEFSSQEPSEGITNLSQDLGELHIGNVGYNEHKEDMVQLFPNSDSPVNESNETLSEMNSLQEIGTLVAEESFEIRLGLAPNGEIAEATSVKSSNIYSLQNANDSFLPIEKLSSEETHYPRAKIQGINSPTEDTRMTSSCIISGASCIGHHSTYDDTVTDERHEEEQFIFSDDEFRPTENQILGSSSSSSADQEMDSLVEESEAHHEEVKKTILTSHTSYISIQKSYQEDVEKKFQDLLEKQQQKMTCPIDIHGFHDAATEIDERMVESLPNMWSQIDSLEADHQPCRSFDASTTSPRWLTLRNNVSSHRKPDEDSEAEPDATQPAGAVDVPSETPRSDTFSSGVGDPSKTIVVPSGTWRLWPFSFKRSVSVKTTAAGSNPPVEGSSTTDVDQPIENVAATNVVKAEVRRRVITKKMRTITPTFSQLKSLNLKEGMNIVTFTFSTAMLGKQQVDARIYLWQWNTRIVISDVDGTITKSDVLGQFMPMVGYDWSHIGVAPLFSAIKENGYQLLFLSARSISQSYITRQFLFNLKQDGKALPDGPVVISPDGLFPSLYREVIRRAPHEFKIACLEDIKALFPSDCNPFYAGFGNRDTDEVSYLRVGIPKGKIFIINPKGEVAVHRRVDTNSYSDLHTLVNGMFPPICTSEQEDYNSWNYWRLPPCMDIDI